MRRWRTMPVLGAYAQRRAEARLRASQRRDEPSQAATLYTLRARVSRFQRMLFGLALTALAMVALVIALIIGIVPRNTTPSSNPEEMSFLVKSNDAMNRMMLDMNIGSSQNVD